MAFTLLTTIIRKRDAALAEYRKWQTLIDTLTNDPDLASVVQHQSAKKADAARRLHEAHQSGNGNGTVPEIVTTAKKRGRKRPVSEKERRASSRRMKAYWKTAAGKKVRAAMIARRKKKVRQWTPEQRANFMRTIEQKRATTKTSDRHAAV